MTNEFNEFPHRLFLDRSAYKPQYMPVSPEKTAQAAQKEREETAQWLAGEMMKHLVTLEIIPSEES